MDMEIEVGGDDDDYYVDGGCGWNMMIKMCVCEVVLVDVIGGYGYGGRGSSRQNIMQQ